MWRDAWIFGARPNQCPVPIILAGLGETDVDLFVRELEANMVKVTFK